MKLLALSLTIAVVAATECSKKNAASTDVPACVRHKIDSMKAAPRANPPGEVSQYTYHGKTVYTISAPCCDQYTVLVDDNCTYLCAPSGGLTGQGDRRCTDFATDAKLVRVVWKDER
ncbi:MAG: hypothetical protein JWP27_879 [Flaviaesturariibacter sp.]|nr:hypothetical protein [Flaviaesturariibacter sp.]